MQTTNPGAPVAQRDRRASDGDDGPAHVVQFYEDDAFLCHVAADHLASGLARRGAAVVIATEAHRNGLAASLAARGVEVERACRSGELAVLDASELLAAIMVDGRPEASRFEQVVATALDGAARAGGGGPVSAYGEMVDLLWKRGNPAGALRLEELWNDLLRAREASLLCGYAIHNFCDASEADRFLELCRLHERVVPTERYTAADGPDRLVEISRLQQRAQALEREVAARRELEGRLRDALAHQEHLLERERVARAEAEEANRAKRDFLAVMSHELRTPLNAIAGYAELLELGVLGPVTEAQRDSLERIQRSQRHLLGLIDEVLVYARMESGKLRYEITDLPVGEALAAVDASVAPQMRSKGLDYLCDGCDAGLVVRADGAKVRQILANLLSNAMKFTEPGGRVRVEVEATGSEVRLHVRDDGIGIPADKLEAIFDAFSQVDTRLARAHEGVGLGLSISRELARGMAGELVVASAPGVGSTFTLVLPRVPVTGTTNDGSPATPARESVVRGS